jgi:hypothetical protein
MFYLVNLGFFPFSDAGQFMEIKDMQESYLLYILWLKGL